MNTQPRSWMNADSCADRCYRPSDVAGLLASAGIVNVPKLVPAIERESDKCLAVPYPASGRKLHLVFFPKRDIRDIADLSAGDLPYVQDCLTLIGQVIRERELWDYRVYTNGPGEQEVSYLHFHLIVW